MAAGRGFLAAAVVGVCALALCGPLLSHGPLPQGSDVFSTNHYLQGFMKAFAEGDLYPRWTDRTNQWLGAPSFVMFPPLTYYGAGAAAWLAGSTIAGFKLYLLLVALAAGAAFHALARDWIGPGLPAALSSGLYLLLPYHVLDRYQRFAMSETTAFVFFPLILLFARRVNRPDGRIGALGLSLSYAGLIYTHIVSALAFSLMLGLWLLWESRGSWRALTRPALGLICGMGLAAPALLPAALEKDAANIAWNREMPNGDFRINFIFKDDLLPGLGIKDPVKPPVLKSAHSQLALGLLAAGLALAWTAPSLRRRRGDVAALSAGCLAAYFLQLGFSTPVWRWVPELASIQFPWRFQTIMVLTSALLTGFALRAGWGAVAGRPSRRALAGPSAVALALAAAVNLGLAWQNTGLKSFQYDERVDQQPFVVNWIEPAFTPIQFEAYRTFKQTPLVMPQAAFTAGSGEVAVESWLSSRRVLRVTSARGGTVTLRSFWFPGWTAALDGAPLALTPALRTGVATFIAPPGTHEVTLRFGPTPVRRAAFFIWMAAIPLTGLLAWWSPRLPAPPTAE